MAGNTPPVAPNGYSTFTPEFNMSFRTDGTSDTTNFLIECDMIIETRG